MHIIYIVGVAIKFSDFCFVFMCVHVGMGREKLNELGKVNECGKKQWFWTLNVHLFIQSPAILLNHCEPNERRSLYACRINWFYLRCAWRTKTFDLKKEKNRWKFKSQKLERFKLNRRQKKPCGQRERTNAYWHRINWCGAVVRKMVAHFSSLSAWSVQWVDNWSLKTNLIYFNHIDK